MMLRAGVSSAAPPAAPPTAASAAPAPAAPSESAERARAAFERAREAFARKSYAAAAAMFEESASHVLHPAPLVNAADAWERAGDFVRSAKACDRVLAMSDLEPQARALVEVNLSRVLKRVATLELEGPTGTTARIDGGDASSLPLRVRLAPGPHDIEASAPSAVSAAPQPPTRMRVFCDPQSVTRRVLTERDLATREPPEAPRQVKPGDAHASKETRRAATSAPPVLTYVTYGVAAVGLGAGLYFGRSTLDARARWADTAALDARSDFYRDRALTNVAFGVAIMAAVVGTVVWLRDAR
jgi:hypothetical protein